MHRQRFHLISPGSLIRILIIESSSVFLKLLGDYLEKIDDFQLEIEFVKSLSDAKIILMNHQFDAVLLNLTLPDNPPETTFEKIKAIIPDTAIIITTSAESQEAATIAVKNGAQDFLFKPDITPILLKKTVFFSIDRKKLEFAAQEREKLLLSQLKKNKRKTGNGWVDCVLDGFESFTKRSLQDPGSDNSPWIVAKTMLQSKFLDKGVRLQTSPPRDGFWSLHLEFPHPLKSNIPNDTPEKEAEQRPVECLVAEDSPINQKIIKRVTETLGMKITIAKNGQEVLDLFREHVYPLILMDIQMPVLDGIETTRLIRREFPADQQPRIIALTASDLNKYASIYAEVGMDACMSKPVSLVKLKGIIEGFYGD